MIEYLKGDAVYPSKFDPNKLNIIMQICNDIGAYGAGFSGALSKRFPIVEKEYRKWSKQSMFAIGQCQALQITDNLFIFNMIAQHDIVSLGSKMSKPPIRYDALDDCLKIVSGYIKGDLLLPEDTDDYVLIHLPRIGAGLAGGKWSVIEALLNENLGQYQMYIYDL